MIELDGHKWYTQEEHDKLASHQGIVRRIDGVFYYRPVPNEEIAADNQTKRLEEEKLGKTLCWEFECRELAKWSYFGEVWCDKHLPVDPALFTFEEDSEDDESE